LCSLSEQSGFVEYADDDPINTGYVPPPEDRPAE
jgi:hypothetical protein